MSERSDDQTGPSQPAAALQQTLDLLKSKDDTSRFVGLTLLKSVLDNQQDLRDDEQTVKKCWDAIPSRFLDRLLRATPNEKRNSDEARHMVDLAVAIIHTFTVLLSSESVIEDEKLASKMVGLIIALKKSSSPTTTTLILQSLLTYTSGNRGAISILEAEELSVLLNIAPEETLALDVLKRAILTSSLEANGELILPSKVDKIFAVLLPKFNNAGPIVFMQFTADVISRSPSEVLSSNPDWLKPLTGLIQRSFRMLPTLQSRKACILLSSALLQTYPTSFPSLLFRDGPKQRGPEGDKPFLYFFMNMVLIDIRTSVPSLMEILDKPSYQEASRFVSAGFDIVSAFIGFLVELLDEVDDDTVDRGKLSDESNPWLLLDPDLLLKLRRDISETMSLTIEFLHDRWNHTHPAPNQLTSPPTTNQTTPESTASDPLVLAAIRALTLWIREDDSPSLRKEASSITEVLLDLYTQSSSLSSHSDPTIPDFTSPVLLSLIPILTTKQGMAAFATANGFATLWLDFERRVLPSQDLSFDGSTIIQVLRASLEESKILSQAQTTSLPEVLTACVQADVRERGERDDVRQELCGLALEMVQRAPASSRRKIAKEITEFKSAIDKQATADAAEGGGWGELLREMKDMGI
ncbi:MAG: hypothetical protein M4579_000532 [Chaenotheca gracillima]|nr:MAG: hypothetical protein M4579_000532 [Chaenotheca gracillima]